MLFRALQVRFSDVRSKVGTSGRSGTSGDTIRNYWKGRGTPYGIIGGSGRSRGRDAPPQVGWFRPVRAGPMVSPIPRASPWAGPSQPFGLKTWARVVFCPNPAPGPLLHRCSSVFICGCHSRSEIEIDDEIEIDRAWPLLPLRETVFLLFSVSSAPLW